MTFTNHVTAMETNNSDDKAMKPNNDLISQMFYHGTKANLKAGDLIEIGFKSNYGAEKKAKYIYLTATLEAAIWGAELSLGKDLKEFI